MWQTGTGQGRQIASLSISGAQGNVSFNVQEELNQWRTIAERHQTSAARIAHQIGLDSRCQTAVLLHLNQKLQLSDEWIAVSFCSRNMTVANLHNSPADERSRFFN
jgi:hypothetical protein